MLFFGEKTKLLEIASKVYIVFIRRYNQLSESRILLVGIGVLLCVLVDQHNLSFYS